jgi:hypothetical protein
VVVAREAALDETASEFQVLLDRMTPAARAIYPAVCKDFTIEITSAPAPFPLRFYSSC